MEEKNKERDGGELQRKRWRRIAEKKMEVNRRERDGGEKQRKRWRRKDEKRWRRIEEE